MSPLPATSLPPVLQGAAAHAWLQAQHSQGAVGMDATLEAAVASTLAQVKTEGDSALYAMAQRFGDSLQPHQPIALTPAEREAAMAQVPEAIKATLQEAAANIRAYAEQLMAGQTLSHQWQHPQGYQLGYHLRPVASVGCYIPAGRYPLVSTVLMTTLSAKAAGVPHVVVACGNPPPEVVYAAHLAGVETIYRLGGAQAMAAMAYGTAQVAPVAMVVGPGNKYVNEAKRQLIGTVGIDMLAGPSEVLVVADDTAPPELIAADLLAQAEHDADARALLMTTSLPLAQAVQAALAKQLAQLELPDYVSQESLPNSALLVLEDEATCINEANRWAPEHLELMGPTVEAQAEAFTSYGTLFVGPHAAVAHGDYMAGPNHTLPTNHGAAFASALSPLSYLRVQNWAKVAAPNAYLNRHTQAFATLEGLTAHAYSAQVRLG